MMAPYLLRLLYLCLAAFFVIHSAVGMVVAASGPAAVRAARRMRPRLAGRFLLALRLLPAALALFVVAGVCVPSYLWLEPQISAEEVGHGCGCERLGRRSSLSGLRLPVWILDAPAPLLALVGVFRSRVVISSSVRSALSAGQLAAALRHEEAHQVSRDNLKRLLLLLAPGLLPGFHGFDAIERGWARFTEWAADDDAVAGDARLSLSLAAALVRIARMGGTPPASPLSASFLGDSLEISARVDRLLSPAPAAPIRPGNGAAVTAVVALAAGCTAFMLHPATLESAHRIIEQLIH